MTEVFNPTVPSALVIGFSNKTGEKQAFGNGTEEFNPFPSFSPHNREFGVKYSSICKSALLVFAAVEVPRWKNEKKSLWHVSFCLLLS